MFLIVYVVFRQVFVSVRSVDVRVAEDFGKNVDCGNVDESSARDQEGHSDPELKGGQLVETSRLDQEVADDCREWRGAGEDLRSEKAYEHVEGCFAVTYTFVPQEGAKSYGSGYLVHQDRPEDDGAQLRGFYRIVAN